MLKNWNKLVKIGKPTVEPLIACLKDKNPEVSKAAVEALGKINDKKTFYKMHGLKKAAEDFHPEFLISLFLKAPLLMPFLVFRQE